MAVATRRQLATSQLIAGGLIGAIGAIPGIPLGIAGAAIGGLIGAVSGTGGLIGFDVRSFLMAIIGSLVVLFCYRTLSMRAMA